MMEYKARVCMRCAQEFEVQYASQVCCGEDCRKKRRQEFPKKQEEEESC